MAFEEVRKRTTYLSVVPTKGKLADIQEKLEEKNKEFKRENYLLPNDVAVGYYQNSFSRMEKNTEGKDVEKWTHYFLKEDKDTLFAINGTRYLDMDLELVRNKHAKGVLTEVTYLGKKPTQKGSAHKFSVRIDIEKVFDQSQTTDTPSTEDKGPTLSPSEVA